MAGTSYAKLAGGDSIYDGWGANQGFFLANGGSLVVDTGFTYQSAATLLREVRRRGRSNSTLVVNTHDHSDHVFGNSLFEPSALTLAHANCKSRLIELGEERIKGYRRFDKKLSSALKGLSISPARLTYSDDEVSFDVGEASMKLIHPRDGAHTMGDTMVLLPEERILFAGDVVWVDYHPNLEDANIAGWLDSLQKISQMKVDHIVPGHGPIADKRCIVPLARYLRHFDEGLSKLVRENIPKEELAKHLELPGSDSWMLRMIVQRNIDILYERYVERVSRGAVSR